MLDKFYTNSEAVSLCLEQVNLNEFDNVIEPSAGCGAFSNEIPNVIAMDIKPEGSSITTMDYMDYKHTLGGSTLVIGNPPFGKASKLSNMFLEHSLAFADCIAFILPNVYNKVSRQRFLPSDWRIKSITKLPKNSFTEDGVKVDIPCSFFVFDKLEGIDLRSKVSNMVTNDFEFTNVEPDFLIVGASRKIIHLTDVTPNHRGYYVKVTGITRVEFIQKFSRVTWSGNGSVRGGVFWLTPDEITEQYNNHHKLDLDCIAFMPSPLGADLIVRRVGSKAGQVVELTGRWENFHFLKVKNDMVYKVMDKLDLSCTDHNMKNINREDLVRVIAEAIKELENGR